MVSCGAWHKAVQAKPSTEKAEHEKRFTVQKKYSLLLRPEEKYLSVFVFSIWYSFPLLRSSVTWKMPHCVHCSSPGCALLSQSSRSLPRHIWFLARLCFCASLWGSIHMFRYHWVMTVSWRERRDHCVCWSQDQDWMIRGNRCDAARGDSWKIPLNAMWVHEWMQRSNC